MWILGLKTITDQLSSCPIDVHRPLDKDLYCRGIPRTLEKWVMLVCRHCASVLCHHISGTQEEDSIKKSLFCFTMHQQLKFHQGKIDHISKGRYNVELHLSFLRLQGQANDFKIQYNNVVRLFILPKSNQPHTFVVITLDPPIRKGQTFYPHIILQFPLEEITECSLSIQEDLLTTKYKDRFQPHYKDLSHDVFTQILKGLSGAKVTRPGKISEVVKMAMQYGPH
ncbi:unnamed protein product [Calypogeia fissa]